MNPLENLMNRLEVGPSVYVPVLGVMETPLVHKPHCWGIKRPEDRCFLFLATKYLTRSEVTTETRTKLRNLNSSHKKPLPPFCLVLAVFSH